MVPMRRPLALTGSMLLGTTLLTALGAAGPTATAADVEERWCSETSAPCVVELAINGVDVEPGDDLDPFVSSEAEDFGGYDNIQFWLEGDLSDLDPSDEVVLSIAAGSGFHIDRVFGAFAFDDIDVVDIGAGDVVTITGSPVNWAHCHDYGVFPPDCQEVALEDSIRFDGDLQSLHDRDDASIGDYTGTNVYYNGIFFDEAPSGVNYFTTELWAPHQFAGGGVVEGDIRFRVSYKHMREEMDIPTPTTLVPGSFTGKINNVESPSAFTIQHDPDGGGMMIDASGFTFSKKRIRVEATTITPTKAPIQKANRKTARKGVLVHALAAPRGAAVTGYAAKCKAGKHVVKGNGEKSSTKVKVKGLKGARAYDCRVRAKSKAGPGKWSAAVRLKRP